jgi:hypothetical protein
MYIQQSIPQITIHLLYIVTLQHVDCGKLIVICGILCCIYNISQFTCCKVSIYNKWIVICSILCCIYVISQFICCKVFIYYNGILETLQQVECDIMYIQQSTPQITIHLLYIDTLQQVNCDIMYIQQNIPQITIHLLYIDTLQQVNCDIICGILCCIYIISQFTCCKVSIYNKWIVICGVFCCIYIIPQSTCCKVSIYNKWIVICGVFCCIYIIPQSTCCKVSIYQLFFLSIVISFQSKCLFLLTIMTLVSFRHMFIILTRMMSQKKNQELLSFHHHFIN